MSTTITDEIVGTLHFKGDVRRADWTPVGPTWDGRFLVAVMSEYDGLTDRTTVHYRTATTGDFPATS